MLTDVYNISGEMQGVKICDVAKLDGGPAQRYFDWGQSGWPELLALRRFLGHVSGRPPGGWADNLTDWRNRNPTIADIYAAAHENPPGWHAPFYGAVRSVVVCRELQTSANLLGAPNIHPFDPSLSIALWVCNQSGFALVMFNGTFFVSSCSDINTPGSRAGCSPLQY